MPEGPCAGHWAAGVKRPGLALAAAVPIAVVVVIALTLAQMAVSFPFGWPAFAVGCLTASALARLGRPLVRWLGVANGPGRPRTSMSRSPAAPFASEAARMGGLLLISFLSAAVFLLAAAGWTWETASQTWDAFFDANAVRYAAETGVVAPNRISDFVYPSPIGNFYPSGFHALGALFMKLGGANAVVATNVTAALLAGALWPGVLAVSAYLVFDRRMTPTYVGIVAGWGLVGLPWGPLGWGVLWATALAAMFMPLAIVGFVGGLGWLTGLSRRGGVALFLVSWPLVWMLHPRVGILNGVLVLGLWTWHAAGRVVAAVVVRRSSHLALGWLAAVGLPLLLLSVAVLRVGRNDAQFAMRGWPVEFGVVREVWGYVANGPIDTGVEFESISVRPYAGAGPNSAGWLSCISARCCWTSLQPCCGMFRSSTHWPASGTAIAIARSPSPVSRGSCWSSQRSRCSRRACGDAF